MKSIFSLTLLILTACGQSPKPVVVDPALAPYMKSFETDVGYNTGGVSATFATLNSVSNPLGETVGECELFSDGSKSILIDPNYWATIDQNGKTELMYHELGHAFGLVHITTTLYNGCPTSIMYPYVFGENSCFYTNTAYYFKELASHI